MANRLDTNKIIFTTMAPQLEDYDLLPEPNKTFRVTFDVYTPRPHFIILPKNHTAITSPDFRLLNDEQMRDLIKAAKSVLLHFKISFGILSIHEGKWRSRTTNEFHVHIHVNTEIYLGILSDTLDKDILGWEKKIPDQRKNKWPQQEGTLLRKPYKESVQDYPPEKYFEKDLGKLENKIKNSKLSRVQPYSGEAGDIEEIVYHKRHPKIGFVAKKLTKELDKDIELTKVLLAMKKYADYYGLTNAKSKDNDDACHLCLYLRPAEDKYLTKNGEEIVDVLGYISVPPSRFYQLCPEGLWTTWFEAFKTSSFKVLT